MLPSEKLPPDGFDKALGIFFKPPILEFSRDLRMKLDEDPEYLKSHDVDVFPRLIEIMDEAGLHLDERNPGEHMHHVIREIVVRLRSFEKGRR